MIMSISETGFINRGETINENNIDSIMNAIDQFIKETNEGVYKIYNIDCKIPMYLVSSENMNLIRVEYEIDHKADDVASTARIMITIPKDDRLGMELMVEKLTERHYRYDATRTDKRNAPTIDEFFIHDFADEDHRAKRYPLFIEDEHHPGEYIINHAVLEKYMSMKDVKFIISCGICLGRSHAYGVFSPDQISVHVGGTRLWAAIKTSGNDYEHAIEIDANNWKLFERIIVNIRKNVEGVEE